MIHRIQCAELEAQIAGLRSAEVELSLRNEKLRHRNDILRGACVVSRQAVTLLQKCIGTSSFGVLPQKNIKAALSEVASLDVGMRYMSFQDTYLTQDPLEPWVPREAAPGLAPKLLSRFLRQDKMMEPIHTSLLDGGPVSLCCSSLLCLCYDPDILARVQHLLQNEATWVHYENTIQKDMAALMAPGSDDMGSSSSSSSMSSNSVDLTQRLINLIMEVVNIGIAGAFLYPAEGYAAWTRYMAEDGHEELMMQKVDQLTEEMQVTAEQMGWILRSVAVFHELQAPLAKAKVDISTRIKQLLSAREETLSCFEGDDGHQELASLSRQLRAVINRINWLDICTGFSAPGVLTWHQVGIFMAGAYPLPPSLMFWTRRLVTRTSLWVPRSLWQSTDSLAPQAGEVPAAAAAGPGGASDAGEHRSRLRP